MSHYFVKLIPHRFTFVQDMTEEERGLMQQHAAYWRDCMKRGEVVLFGPVMDPAGVYGMGVLDVDTQQAVETLLAADPAAGLMRSEFCPMQAVMSP
jgi:uncharacterized protein YciI